MKKCSAFIFVLVFAVCSLFAFDGKEKYFSQLTAEELSVLESGESLEARTNRNQDVYRLAPADSEAYKIAYEASKADHSFTVGVLQFIDYPENYKDMSQQDIMLDVYNRMLKISTMKGIKYCSYTSGNKMKTLFSDAHLIAGPKKHEALQDDVAKALVPSAS